MWPWESVKLRHYLWAGPLRGPGKVARGSVFPSSFWAGSKWSTISRRTFCWGGRSEGWRLLSLYQIISWLQRPHIGAAAGPVQKNILIVNQVCGLRKDVMWAGVPVRGVPCMPDVKRGENWAPNGGTAQCTTILRARRRGHAGQANFLAHLKLRSQGVHIKTHRRIKNERTQGKEQQARFTHTRSPLGESHRRASGLAEGQGPWEDARISLPDEMHSSPETSQGQWCHLKKATAVLTSVSHEKAFSRKPMEKKRTKYFSVPAASSSG